ncbi:uncharacterized protein LOC122077387 [Macadamia integrifolia]|uniref:uncharacterized protein LOC122077387 n=1 Tax=Macadamia integrifolia TaxID=60698 RepID=UPI001C4EF06D|nr:uncharacterized protein LOC122077387 [Macadamia integrifolia]
MLFVLPGHICCIFLELPYLLTHPEIWALMRASRKNTANIGGSMTLFTVWAYERLGVGRPDVVRLCRPFPRAVRWKCRRRTDNIHNCYRPYRQELDQLKECESERSARKATVLQMATIYTVFGGTLLNIGITVSSLDSQVIANGSFIGAGKFIMFISHSLDKNSVSD